MCQAIRDYGKENLNKGKAIGRNEGIIQTLIKLLESKLGHLSKDTLITIHSCTQEQLDSLTIHIFDINSEKDIFQYITKDEKRSLSILNDYLNFHVVWTGYAMLRGLFLFIQISPIYFHGVSHYVIL